MKVCVVGGGAAGLVTAYLLRQRHEVTVFEASGSLGGNICTLNVNIPCNDLDRQLVLDAGVIEFEENHFANFRVLLDELGVERLQVPGTTAVYLNDCRSLRSPGHVFAATSSPIRRLGALIHLLPIGLAQRRFQQHAKNADPEDLYLRPIGSLLEQGDHATWMRMLLMYAYSMAYQDTLAMPAAMAAPMLSEFTGNNTWTTVKGGTYVYVQRMIDAMDARLVTNATVKTVSRANEHIDVMLADGSRCRFDKIVIATTPEQVLRMIETPTADETRCFSDWSSHTARTVVHTDTGLYERRGINYFSEFDLFETSGDAGYSAYLNRLSAIPDGYPKNFFLAFNLDQEIREDRIIHEQIHKTPSYSVAALRHREDVIRSNGSNNTFFAGAWLGNGLHEGAIQSAQRVAKLLDG